MKAFARRWRAWLDPIPKERRELNARRWAELPAHLRTAQQIMGRGHHSCGATHGVMERCDFACTSCYLSKVANATPPLEGAEVRAQLDQLRAFLGPQGKAQITSGEVTLLPVEVLGGYVAYARSIGLDPMVMTHGQRLLDEPDYLRRLVEDYGLKKLSIHIDSTQRGRRGWHQQIRECDLHPIRSAYAELIRDIRKQTGRTLHVATTVTINQRNLEQIPDIFAWLLDNVDAFRMISLQPVAAVGRTQDSRIEGLTLDAVWERICSGLGQNLNRHAMHFGHPECHIVAPLVVYRYGGAHFVLEIARTGNSWDQAFCSKMMRAIGGFSTYDKSRTKTAVQLLQLALQNPLLLLESPFYAAYRLWGLRRQLLSMALALLRRQAISARPLALVVHKFMSPEELDTQLGKERLAACVFQLPVEGEMVPMCTMNASGLRLQLDQERRSRAAS